MSWTFREWWDKNGGNLNTGRQFRYHLDPSYKERVLQTNKNSRDRKKAAELQDRIDSRVVKSKGDAPKFKTIPLKDGTAAYTIGALAVAIDRSIQTIRQWEKKGIIEATDNRTPRGDRLFTQKQIDAIKAKLTSLGKLDEPTFAPTVRTEYKVQEGSQVVERDLFQMGVLANACERSIVTMDLMESKGILPATPFRYGGLGRRLFTPPMIEIVVETFIRHGGEVRGEENQKSFYDQVLTGWNALGIMEHKIAE